LNIAAREIRGLANKTIFLLPETASGAGLMHIRTGGRLEAVAPLVKYSLDEMARLHKSEGLITGEELEQAKGALILGRWQEALDGARQASETYAVEAVRYGATDRILQWPEAVRAVTAEEVKELATKYLDGRKMVTVVVGPIEKIRTARHPRWPISLEALESSDPSTG
jgi:predicted Zn-dependent peptidase